jgi:hypothetical protein
MTGPIDPIRAARAVSRSPRPSADAPDDAGPDETVNLPAVIDAAPTPAPAAKAPAAFAAQLIAGAQRRGLRGGPGVLVGAQSAYLDAEWSGTADRRTGKGQIAKTEI